MTAYRKADSTDLEAVGRSFDALRALTVASTKTPPPTCRCGWLDHAHTEQPVIDMSTAPGIFTLDNTPIRRSCRACQHPIVGAVVAHRPNPGHLVRNFYHAVCIDLGGRND